MTFVTVFRRVPKPITGMIGTLYDPDFERFEANLDWLETTGVLVEQFDPSTAHEGSRQAPGGPTDRVRRGRPLSAVDPGERIGGVARHLPVEGATGPRSRTGTGLGAFGRLRRGRLGRRG